MVQGLSQLTERSGKMSFNWLPDKVKYQFNKLEETIVDLETDKPGFDVDFLYSLREHLLGGSILTAAQLNALNNIREEWLDESPI